MNWTAGSRPRPAGSKSSACPTSAGRRPSSRAACRSCIWQRPASPSSRRPAASCSPRGFSQDLAALLTSRGVALHSHSSIAELDPARAAVRTADGKQDRADALVIAAGPWTPDLLPALAGRVTPSRQVALYLEPPAELRAAWAAAPMLLDQIEAAAGGFYAVPPVDGSALKVGDHGFSLTGHPDRDRAPSPDELATVLALAGSRLPDLGRYRTLEAKTCFYSVTEGERFIAERIEHAWVLAGFSGHGFKFGALIGERVAAALAGELAADQLTAFAAGRV